MRGNNNTILLFFSCENLPYSISFNHVKVNVKKYRPRPNQCYKCFEYGHITSSCSNNKKCIICSAEHITWDDDCSLSKFCFHCNGNHSPTSRICPTHKFEQEVVEVANDHHISIGSAKRLVKGANKTPNSSYANATKLPNVGRNQVSKANVNKNDRNASQPSSSHQDAQLSRANGLTLNTNHDPSQDSNSVPHLITSSQDMELEILPDISNSPTADKPDQQTLVSSRKEDPVEEPGKSISLELESSVITIQKKTKDNDGFSSPGMKKRARPTSPKSNNSGIKTSNKFSPLNESPISKKKAISMEDTAKDPVLPATVKVQDPSCLPKIAVLKTTLPSTKYPKTKVEEEKTGNKITKSITPSTSKDGKKGPQKSKILKKNFSLPSKDSSSHSKSGKKS